MTATSSHDSALRRGFDLFPEEIDLATDLLEALAGGDILGPVSLGVAIVPKLTFSPLRDRNLRSLPVGHLFGMNVSRVAVKQGAYLRSYIYTFIELLAPTLNRKLVEQAMRGEHENYEL